MYSIVLTDTTVTSKNTRNHMSRIPVAYLILGWENNREAIIDFFRNAKTTINMVTDAAAPPITTSKLYWLIKEMLAARRRGVSIRLITDITMDNLSDCKDRITRVDAMRHLEGISVIVGVSDSEYIALVPSSAPREEIKKIQFIQSDYESVVAIKQHIFNALWNRAISAQLRIDELEGIVVGDGVARDETKNMIDRIYKCEKCKLIFIYSFEVGEHRAATGHRDIREYPIA